MSARITRLLPRPQLLGFLIQRNDLSRQRQRERNRVIRHLLSAVVWHIANRHAVFPGSLAIHAIKTHTISDNRSATAQFADDTRGELNIVPKDNYRCVKNLSVEVGFGVAKKSFYLGHVLKDRLFDRRRRLAERLFRPINDGH